MPYYQANYTPWGPFYTLAGVDTTQIKAYGVKIDTEDVQT